MAAFTARGAGGNPLYLGADLPDGELLPAVETVQAGALALYFGRTEGAIETEKSLRELRAALSPEVELWVGGSTGMLLELPAGASRIEGLESLEQRVALLSAKRPRRRRSARA